MLNTNVTASAVMVSIWSTASRSEAMFGLLFSSEVAETV